jgi:hypothetical protein
MAPKDSCQTRRDEPVETQGNVVLDFNVEVLEVIWDKALQEVRENGEKNGGAKHE